MDLPWQFYFNMVFVVLCSITAVYSGDILHRVMSVLIVMLCAFGIGGTAVEKKLVDAVNTSKPFTVSFKKDDKQMAYVCQEAVITTTATIVVPKENIKEK